MSQAPARSGLVRPGVIQTPDRVVDATALPRPAIWPHASRMDMPLVNPRDGLSRRVLGALIDMLTTVRQRSAPRDPLFDPVAQAIHEIQSLYDSHPGKLWRSPALYRAIDDLAGTALRSYQPLMARKALTTLTRSSRERRGW